MKTASLALVVLLSAPVLAAPMRSGTQPVSLGPTPLTIKEASAKVRHRTRRAVEPHAVSGLLAPALLFPIAGNAAGQNSTYWRTDLQIGNHREIAQEIYMYFLPLGRDNSDVQGQRFLLEPYHWYPFRDVVNNTFKSAGMGAIMVYTFANNELDEDALLEGFARIYTTHPTIPGHLSMPFPAVSLADSWGNDYSVAYGGRQDDTFRSNVGIFNDDELTRTFTIVVYADGNRETQFQMTVPPFTTVQQPVPTGKWDDFVINVMGEAEGWWSGYIATVDNRNGDGWTAHVWQP